MSRWRSDQGEMRDGKIWARGMRGWFGKGMRHSRISARICLDNFKLQKIR